MKITKNHLAMYLMSEKGLNTQLEYYQENYSPERHPNFLVFASFCKTRITHLREKCYNAYYVAESTYKKAQSIEVDKFFDNPDWIFNFNKSHSALIITKEYTCVYTISASDDTALSVQVYVNHDFDAHGQIFTLATTSFQKGYTTNKGVGIDEEGNILNYNPLDLYPEEDFPGVNKILLAFISMIFFIEFAQVKIIEVNPKNLKYGCKGHFNSEIYNETDKKIIVVDAGWDTTTKTGAFTVRGFFRWQRYGERNALKKLIWVDEFQKEGYIRQAGITKQ